MPPFFIIHHLGQHVKRLWIGHILCIGPLTLIMHSESSFLHYRIMIYYKLQNLSSNIASDNCSLLVIAHCVMFV